MAKQPEITEATREAFVDAFCWYYARMPIEKITVKEVARKAGYSRVTFYNYFKDVYDLLDQIQEEFISAVFADMKQNILLTRDWNQFALSFLNIAREREREVRVFFVGANTGAFVEKVKACVMPEVLPILRVSPEDQKARLAVEFYLSGVIPMLGAWLRSDRALPAEELAALIQGILEDGVLQQLERPPLVGSKEKEGGLFVKTIADTCTLRSGVTIPALGFGTYKTPEGEVAEASVLAALEAGYRHIDTAAFYGNEGGVGRAIRKSGIPRQEIFVTTKVWNTERGYEKAKASILASLERLGLDYVDLCLIHWPAIPKQYPDWEAINVDTWRAFVELYKQGKIRAIGVSNFKPRHLEALMKTEVPPMVNQIECHPGQPQNETIAWCKANGILVEAWSPMGRGKLLDHPLLTGMAAKYGVSVAQLCIRWCLQRDIVPLPKSVTPDRIRENARVFDFAITPEDMETLTNMPPTATSHDPDEIDF